MNLHEQDEPVPLQCVEITRRPAGYRCGICGFWSGKVHGYIVHSCTETRPVSAPEPAAVQPVPSYEDYVAERLSRHESYLDSRVSGSY